MSLNPVICLKLQLGFELRKVSKAPNTIAELKTVLDSLFGRQNFLVTYQDEEGDFISITDDFELQELYNKHLGKPSLKLFLKEVAEPTVFDRIESLKNALMQSVSGGELSQLELIDENTQNTLSVEDLSQIKNSSSESPQETLYNVEIEPVSKIIPEPEHFETIKPEPEHFETITPELEHFETPKLENFETIVEPTEILPLEEKKTEPKSKKCQKKSKNPKKVKAQKPKDVVTHTGVFCDNCEMNPIVGIRYKCTTCYDFDLCESCEASLDHEHPMIKIKTPMKTAASPMWGQGVHNSGSLPPMCQLKQFITSHIKYITKKKLKVKVIQEMFSKESPVLAGSTVQISWELRNKGRNAWPEGSRVVLAKGDFVAEDVFINEVQPGSNVVVTVAAKVPDVKASCSGVWKIVVGNKSFGRIKASVNVIQDIKAATLTKMGFDLEKAKLALEATNGDIDLAISQILRN